MGTMQRLLAHPADQPLVHVDHSHRKSTATSTATTKAPVRLVTVPAWVIRKVEPDWWEYGRGGVMQSMELPLNSTTLGKVDSVPWKFGLGTEEGYKVCYTYRDMSSVVQSMETIKKDSGDRESFAVSDLDKQAGPDSPDPFYLPMATVVIPDANNPIKRTLRFSMHFVASDDGLASRGYQFTKRGKNGLAGPFRSAAGYEPIGPLYMTMPEQMTEAELDTTNLPMGDITRKNLETLEYYKQHQEYEWNAGWHGNRRR